MPLCPSTCIQQWLTHRFTERYGGATIDLLVLPLISHLLILKSLERNLSVQIYQRIVISQRWGLMMRENLNKKKMKLAKSYAKMKILSPKMNLKSL